MFIGSNRQWLSVVLLASTLTLSACGGGSSNTTTQPTLPPQPTTPTTPTTPATNQAPVVEAASDFNANDGTSWPKHIVHYNSLPNKIALHDFNQDQKLDLMLVADDYPMWLPNYQH